MEPTQETYVEFVVQKNYYFHTLLHSRKQSDNVYRIVRQNDACEFLAEAKPLRIEKKKEERIDFKERTKKTRTNIP